MEIDQTRLDPWLTIDQLLGLVGSHQTWNDGQVIELMSVNIRWQLVSKAGTSQVHINDVSGGQGLFLLHVSCLSPSHLPHSLPSSPSPINHTH